MLLLPWARRCSAHSNREGGHVDEPACLLTKPACVRLQVPWGCRVSTPAGPPILRNEGATCNVLL
jgi:hypothetical protein